MEAKGKKKKNKENCHLIKGIKCFTGIYDRMVVDLRIALNKCTVSSY